MPRVQIEALLCPSLIFSRHLGRHLVFLKMLIDVKATSVRFFNGNIYATRISQEKMFEPYFRVKLDICRTNEPMLMRKTCKVHV